MAEPLRARFYFLRSDGCPVPLIAMDELPQSIQIEGVPRILSVEDIAQTNMVAAPGKHEARHELHRIIDINKNSALSAFNQRQSHDCLNPAAAEFVGSKTQPPAADTDLTAPGKSYGVAEQKPGSTGFQPISTPVNEQSEEPFSKFGPLSQWQSMSDSDSRLPPKGKKAYCSHWMSTGECDYAQQGCLYKHIMPMDLDTLNHLGFQDIPKWFREKHGIGRMNAVPGSGAHYRSFSPSPSPMQANWRTGARNGRASIPTPMLRAVNSSLHQLRRGPNRALITAAPRPLHAKTQPNLLDLESRPPTPAATNKPVNGLLNSKFAPLKPAPGPVGDTDRKSFSSASTTSDTGRSFSSNIAESGSSTPTSAGSDDVSAHSKEQQTLQPSEGLQKWQAYADASHCDSTTSRRDSVATDYETGLVREQEEQDAREAAADAESEARATSQQEQANLNKMQEQALAQAKSTLRGRADVREADKKQAPLSAPAKHGTRVGPARTKSRRIYSKKVDADKKDEA
ncbi:hypothetical protein LTS08_001749 [Lithohypha guttulata]|nr:hypothetical protein LTS08_001749 [Lithohypha guttulata]